MPINLNELKRERNGMYEEAKTLLETSLEREDRSMTPEEETRYTELEGKIDKADTEISRIERMRELETKHLKGEQHSFEEIKDFNEWIHTARFNPTDPALEQRSDANQEMVTGEKGGLIIPPRFDPVIRMVDIPGAIFRPRATVIPAGSPPDQTLSFPALDQTDDLYAGVDVEWIAEGEEKPDTGTSFKEVSLTPHEVAASMFVTDKLLRNTSAIGPIVVNLMREAIRFKEERAFLNGSGVGQPAGFLNSDAKIEVTRDTANQIKYDDIIQMYSKAKTLGNGVFITSRTTLPQLMKMKDDAGSLIWQPNARDGSPGTLLGIPVLINDFNPTLGNTGDLMLVDLKYYLIKDGSGMSVAFSEHVRFRKNQTCIKIYFNVDGKSWLTAPITERDGSTQVSPFVILKKK